MKRIFHRLPFYPILAATYPILYLLSENIQQVTFLAGLRSLLVFLLIGSTLYLCVYLLTRDGLRSGIISFVMLLGFLVIFFFLYAPAYRAFREVSLFGEILGRHRILIPASLILILLAGGISFIIFRHQEPQTLHILTFILNVFSFVLILIPTSIIITESIKGSIRQSQAEATLPPIEKTLNPPQGELPDIYYIILDMHTSDNVLQKLLFYDSTEFTLALQEKGFLVATCSQSNYATTHYSLPSSLNMNYIQKISDSYAATSLFPMLQSSIVQRSLEQIGYSIYAFDSGYSFTSLTNADVYISQASDPWELLTYPGISPFENLIMLVSGGKILYETREQLSPALQYILYASYVEYRERILFTLNTLPELTQQPGPKFVFAHILAPHEPFVFNEDGSPALLDVPFALDGVPLGYVWENYYPRYVSELKYLHQVVIEVVDQIIANSSPLPIIIIQGDHGLTRLQDQKAQYAIYNAYYLRGETPAAVYDTISPVNSFRLIFNQVFMTDYPYLPDESYSFAEDQGEFLLVTDTFPCP